MTALSGEVLVVSRHSPYGSGLARAALDTALAAAAFDHTPSLLFAGDGVLQLLPAQDSSAIGQRNQARVLDSLPLYDIERLFVDEAALASYQLAPSDLTVNVQVLNDSEIRQLLLNHRRILSF